MGYIQIMQTVLETPQFIKASAKLLSEQERGDLIDMLATNPYIGAEIRGSGGVRKVRFATGKRGKSGSTRVIYFVYSENAPIYLITCFAKGKKDNLSKAEINAFAKLTAAIKTQYRRRK